MLFKVRILRVEPRLNRWQVSAKPAVYELAISDVSEKEVPPNSKVPQDCLMRGLIKLYVTYVIMRGHPARVWLSLGLC